MMSAIATPRQRQGTSPDLERPCGMLAQLPSVKHAARKTRNTITLISRYITHFYHKPDRIKDLFALKDMLRIVAQPFHEARDIYTAMVAELSS
jgi:hypothetical protein